MKYKKPKILLVDMPDDSFKTLKDSGYNVSIGSFGKQYKVPKSAGYEPIIFCSSLKNISENEIIFINLTSENPTEKPKENYLKPLEETNLWSSAVGVK